MEGKNIEKEVQEEVHEIKQEKKEVQDLEKVLKTMKVISYTALGIGLIAIIVAIAALISPHQVVVTAPSNQTVTTTLAAPSRLTNIDQPLNTTQLSIINNAPDSYFETAGEMYLNKTLANEVTGLATNVSGLYINGKPSVIYFGSITCIFCAENRWAMAMALSRFGSFSALFKGYSSLGDGDVPTLYWTPDHYNTTTVDIGSYYTSNYINLIAIEDTAPITGGFSLQPLNVIQQEINATHNSTYIEAINYIISLNNFQGTPYTIWGKFNVNGADAIDFGNSMPQQNQALPIASMSHAQILEQLANPSDQFAWTEYAAADIYIAQTCATLNNTAPICSLPAIQKIEQLNKY